MTSCLPSNFHPFHPLYSVTPNLSAKHAPPPKPTRSIIRPELIAMHFTAEVRKPYPWISTMYPPPAYPHTSVPSLHHPGPQCVASPDGSADWAQGHHPSTRQPPHRQTIDQIRKVPITVLTAGPLGSRVASGHSLSITWPPLCTQTDCELPRSGKWIHTWHTILVVYIAVNSSAETVWQSLLACLEMEMDFLGFLIWELQIENGSS